jgi:hypothetical protein
MDAIRHILNRHRSDHDGWGWGRLGSGWPCQDEDENAGFPEVFVRADNFRP